MMKKKKLQKILFSKELLKATKEVQKEWIQELGLENLDRTEIVDINEYPLLKDPPEADEHWEMLMAGLPKDPEDSEAIEKFLKKAVKHHERYKKSFIEEIINGKRDVPKNYSLSTFKNRLIEEGYFQEECTHCGYNETNIKTNEVCLNIDFQDDNNKNLSLDNIRLLCANCYLSFNGSFQKSKIFCK